MALILPFSLISNATNYFIQEDNLGIISKYEVNQKFLSEFAYFIRRSDDESKPFLSDIYHALEEGYTVTYNRDQNTVSGLDDYHWRSLTPNELKRMHGRTSSLEATINTKKHRFFVALQRLDNFYMAQ